MATFPIKVEKPEMKIMGLNILPMVVKVNKMMPEGMRKKSVVKQVTNYLFIFCHYQGTVLLEPIWIKVNSSWLLLQGVRGQSGFFNWALRERNIQLRLYLKVVLKSLDVKILIIRTNLKKSNLGCPQQPPTEKVQKLKNDISWFH